MNVLIVTQQKTARGSNGQDVSAVSPYPPLIPLFLWLISFKRAIKRMEHERQRALQRKMFEDQMRALEQQQAQELLTIPVDATSSLQHLAVSAPTTPPRVNALLNGEVSPNMSLLSRPSVDADILSRAVGSAVDKRKSVTYAPSVNNSPDTAGSNGQTSFARPGGAKSMPASRRTSASEHDEDLAGHLQGLSLAGERADRASTPSGTIPQPQLISTNGRYSLVDGVVYGNVFNAGMMLDEQLDQEMHSQYH